MRRRLAIIAVLVFVQLVSSVWAQNDPDSSKKHSLYAEIGKAPVKARARQNPFENDSEAVAAGGNLYAQHCAECHGSKAEGLKRGGPSLLVAEVQGAESGAIFWVLTNGVVRHGMPVWSKLPEPQRWQLVSFLKSLKKPVSPIPVEESSP
jgi:cytochrome c oxidase cbb3-type subunit 2